MIAEGRQGIDGIEGRQGAEGRQGIDGIILVLSCLKHINTRLKDFKLPKDEYAGWKVIYVIGDLFLDCDYKLVGNFLIVKCEDSYIHLLKKLVMSLKYLYEIYDIKGGVLRCGDDLVFNEDLLQSFLDSPKQYKIKNNIGDIDFLGNCSTGKSMFEHDLEKYENKSSASLHFVYYYKDSRRRSTNYRANSTVVHARIFNVH
jgi:UDP-3-O-acyl-N-acetylglucosamine deacetylase